MRLKSTGLGKMELIGELKDIRRVDDLIVFYVQTTSPVRWRTTMAFQVQDLRGLIFGLFRPKNLWYLIKALYNEYFLGLFAFIERKEEESEVF